MTLLKTIALSLIFFASAEAIATAQPATSPVTVPQIVPAPAVATAPEPTVEIEVGTSHETLTNDRGFWDSSYLQITRRADGGHILYGRLLATDRFSQFDRQWIVGDYFPLAKNWSGFVEASVSPSHRILPSYTLSGGVQLALGAGWFGGAIVRHTEYDTQSVNAAVVSVERYWKQFRGYYALTGARLNATGTDVAQTFAFGYYYGSTGRDHATITHTVGRDVENVGAPALLASRVREWALTGRQQIGTRTSLRYELGVGVQGSSYTRTGGSLGLDYRL